MQTFQEVRIRMNDSFQLRMMHSSKGKPHEQKKPEALKLLKKGLWSEKGTT